MAYIGNTASTRYVANRAASVYSGDGSTYQFTLEEAVGSDEDILVSVDGVIQEPSVAYTVSSGTTLDFGETTPPSSNAGNNIFVYYLSLAKGSIVHPSNVGLTATTGAFSSNATVAGTIAVTGTSTLTGVTALGNTGSTVKSEGGAVTTNIAQGLAKAWVNFTGVTTTAARDSLNVGSFTDEGTGATSVVYTSAMANNDYTGSYYTSASAGTGVADFNNAYTGAFGINEFRTTALIRVLSYSSSAIDSQQNDVIIHGDLA